MSSSIGNDSDFVRNLYVMFIREWSVNVLITIIVIKIIIT